MDISGCIHSSNPMMTQWESGVSFDLLLKTRRLALSSDHRGLQSRCKFSDKLFLEYRTECPEIQTWNAGTYTCTGYDGAGCSHTERSSLPIPDLCTVPSGCYSSCDPVEICGPGNLSSYQWHFNGSAIPGEIDSCTV